MLVDDCRYTANKIPQADYFSRLEHFGIGLVAHRQLCISEASSSGTKHLLVKEIMASQSLFSFVYIVFLCVQNLGNSDSLILKDSSEEIRGKCFFPVYIFNFCFF